MCTRAHTYLESKVAGNGLALESLQPVLWCGGAQMCGDSQAAGTVRSRQSSPEYPVVWPTRDELPPRMGANNVNENGRAGRPLCGDLRADTVVVPLAECSGMVAARGAGLLCLCSVRLASVARG